MIVLCLPFNKKKLFKSCLYTVNPGIRLNTQRAFSVFIGFLDSVVIKTTLLTHRGCLTLTFYACNSSLRGLTQYRMSDTKNPLKLFKLMQLS